MSIGDLTVFSVISRFNLVSVCRKILTEKKLNSQSIFSTGEIFFSDREKSDRKIKSPRIYHSQNKLIV